MKEAKDGTKRPWVIRRERGEDAPLVEALTAASFGPGRFAKSAYRLREGVAPEAGLGFVAVEDSILRGAVRFWPVAIGAQKVLLLGPLAVQPDQRGRGIGIDLMKAGIEAAKTAGWTSVILVGDEPYYARVGFARLPSGKVIFPGPVDPRRVLGLSLVAGAAVDLAGVVRRARIDDPVCAAGAEVA